MVQLRVRAVPLAGLLLVVILFTPLPVESRPNPCPQGGGGALNSLLDLMIPLATACPPTFWAKTYGESNALSAQATPDGGSIAAGLIHYGTPCCNRDFKVIRLDGDGNIVWQKTYGLGISQTQNEYGTSVDLTPDGGFIIAGTTDSFGAGGTDFWLLRLDGNGNIIWQKTYGGISSEGGSNPSVRTTTDGGFIVAGSTQSFGAGGYDFWLLRLDSNGGNLWQRTYGGPSAEIVRSVQLTSDGGFIVAGATNSFGAGGYDMLVLRLSADGNVVWQKAFGGLADEAARAAQQTSDGGYIVSGSGQSFGAGLYDVLVMKLDENGNPLWQKTYGGTSYDFGYSGRVTSDGGFIVAGSTESFGAGSEDMWLFRLDSNGNMVWQKTYGGSKLDRANSVDVAIDGTLIVAGGTNSFTGGGFWVLHLDANGSIPGPNCKLGQTSTAVANNSGLLTADTTVVATDSAATMTSTTVTGVNSTAKLSKQCVG